MHVFSAVTYILQSDLYSEKYDIHDNFSPVSLTGSASHPVPLLHKYTASFILCSNKYIVNQELICIADPTAFIILSVSSNEVLLVMISKANPTPKAHSLTARQQNQYLKPFFKHSYVVMFLCVTFGES